MTNLTLCSIHRYLQNLLIAFTVVVDDGKTGEVSFIRIVPSTVDDGLFDDVNSKNCGANVSTNRHRNCGQLNSYSRHK